MEFPYGSAQTPSLLLRISTTVGYGVLILVNIAANEGWLGHTNSEISKKFHTPLTPAGWAFSIWGFIFLLQGLGAIYQLLPHGYGPDGWKQRVVNTIGYGWVVGWACECLWQICFVQEKPAMMWLCLIALLGAFVSFAATLMRLFSLKDQVGSLSSVWLYSIFFLPTSVNTAWLSVASSLGVLIVPVAYGATANLDLMAVLLAVVVTGLGATVVHKERDSAYGLTLVWAFMAVFGKQNSGLVKAASLVCLATMCLLSIFSVLRRKRSLSSDNLNSEFRQPLTYDVEEEQLRSPGRDI